MLQQTSYWISADQSHTQTQQPLMNKLPDIFPYAVYSFFLSSYSCETLVTP